MAPAREAEKAGGMVISCIGPLGLFLLWHNGCNPKLAVIHTNRKVHGGVRIDVHQVGADYWMGILLCRQSSDGRRGGLPEARCEEGRRLRLSKIVLKYHLVIRNPVFVQLVEGYEVIKRIAILVLQGCSHRVNKLDLWCIVLADC